MYLNVNKFIFKKTFLTLRNNDCWTWIYTKKTQIVYAKYSYMLRCLQKAVRIGFQKCMQMICKHILYMV